MDLFGSTWNHVRSVIKGYGFSDEATREAMRSVDEAFDYTLDPHTAVGYLALQSYQHYYPNTPGIVLGTAHPAKFQNDVEAILGHPIEVPERLAQLRDRTKQSTPMDADYSNFKRWLLKNMG
jgi:threonine synthase